MRFRPCIDLHGGCVKQIVGSTLEDNSTHSLEINFSSSYSPSYYTEMYRRDNLVGGHVIMLGPDNQAAAVEALQAWPGGLQIGGGITADNASWWLDQGASHVIITSYVFRDGLVDENRLAKICRQIGAERLVLDLSCRWREDGYYVVTDRWQKYTDFRVGQKTMAYLAGYCDEFLVHAVDVEGKGMGVDRRLIDILATSSAAPVTYAGGIASMADLELIQTVGKNLLDATVGSTLDIFGGDGLRYDEVVAFLKQD